MIFSRLEKGRKGSHPKCRTAMIARTIKFIQILLSITSIFLLVLAYGHYLVFGDIPNNVSGSFWLFVPNCFFFEIPLVCLGYALIHTIFLKIKKTKFDRIDWMATLLPLVYWFLCIGYIALFVE